VPRRRDHLEQHAVGFDANAEFVFELEINEAARRNPSSFCSSSMIRSMLSASAL
jgi:hypothetical protein